MSSATSGLTSRWIRSRDIYRFNILSQITGYFFSVVDATFLVKIRLDNLASVCSTAADDFHQCNATQKTTFMARRLARKTLNGRRGQFPGGWT